MKHFLRSLFGTSSKEVNGILVLVVIFLLSLAYPSIYLRFKNDQHSISNGEVAKLDSLVTLLTKLDSSSALDHQKFRFNPNITSADDLSRLGFSDRAIRQIINYRSKGGQFRTKKDLFKIYAIDTGHVQGLYTFIDLPESIDHKSETSGLRIENKVKISPANSKQRVVKVINNEVKKFSLNLADTAMLQTVNGIGPVLAKRIISFRDKLGGFAQKSQLYEVYNLDSLVVERLLEVCYLDERGQVRSLPINTITEDKLAEHPYVSRQQARLIVAYRNQHGNYYSGEDLLAVYLVSKSDIERLMPYLSFNR